MRIIKIITFQSYMALDTIKISFFPLYCCSFFVCFWMVTTYKADFMDKFIFFMLDMIFLFTSSDV